MLQTFQMNPPLYCVSLQLCMWQVLPDTLKGKKGEFNILPALSAVFAVSLTLQKMSSYMIPYLEKSCSVSL
jgi:hypothetical protein